MIRCLLAVFLGILFLSQTTAQEKRITRPDSQIRQIRTSSSEIAISFVDQDIVHRLAETRADQLSKIVRIWNQGVDPDEYPSVAGQVTVNDANELVFEPRFPLRRGKSYIVLIEYFDTSISKTIEIPDRDIPVSQVGAIYPSADNVPENLLKFYVQFTGPMQKGDVYSFVRLRESGSTGSIELPFLELEQELWSRDSKRLMLLLDPGRIKRGLKPREEVGPIFLPGQDYELVISGRWPDQYGRPLGKDIVKKFRAGAYDELQPDPKRWQIDAPVAGSQDPLTIKFLEPLDRSMLEHVIRVTNTDGLLVEGQVAVEDEERLWKFVPSDVWPAGSYSVEVDTTLEDLAGNSVGKMFDVDVFGKPGTTIQAAQIKMPFEIKK